MDRASWKVPFNRDSSHFICSASLWWGLYLYFTAKITISASPDYSHLQCSIPTGVSVWIWGRQTRELAPLLGVQQIRRRFSKDWRPQCRFRDRDHSEAQQRGQNQTVQMSLYLWPSLTQYCSSQDVQQLYGSQRDADLWSTLSLIDHCELHWTKPTDIKL